MEKNINENKNWMNRFVDTYNRLYGINESTENNPIPFEVNFSLVERINVDDLLNDTTNEGIEVRASDDASRVSYNPSHNDGVDSSIENNPTQFKLEVPSIQLTPDQINIFAIMQRVAMTKSVIGSDGNPLLYAFKNEKSYHFDSDEDKMSILNDIKNILGKFVDQYFSANNGEIATIVIPSGNALNNEFAKWFQSVVESKGKKVKIYNEVLDKITTEAVREEVIEDGGSEFNKWIGKMPLNKAMKIKNKLLKFLDDMDENHGGTFSYHFVKDPDIRNHMSMSMKLSKTPSIAKEYGDINECHVLLLDDSVSRGASMKEAYNLLVRHYHPKSITGLVLFSADQRTINKK